MKISILVRSTNPNGNIKIRFRITHKGKHLYRPTDIIAPIRELREKYVCSGKGDNFTCSGELKPKVTIYNVKLYEQIKKEIEVVQAACNNISESGSPFTNDNLEKIVECIKHPEKAKQKQVTSMLELFQNYADRMYKAKLVKSARKSIYERVIYSTKQFFIINKYDVDMPPKDFTANMLLEIREFYRDEYKYVVKYPKLYAEVRRKTREQRSDNTIANRMNVLKVFFDDLKAQKIVADSPFGMMNRSWQKEMFKREYDEPIYLTLDELQIIRNTEVPEPIKETKDIFILNCLLGCRINELCKLKREDIHIENGIPYYSYLPSKTIRVVGRSRGVINKPLMKTALEILNAHNFHFAQLGYTSGSRGYNAKLKKLFEVCGLNRDVQVTNAGDVVFMPLYECASTKIARKTHIEAMQQFQFNVLQFDPNAAKLHRNGSAAIDRYANAAKLIINQFNMMCMAFGEEMYRVDENLNII